MTAAAHSAATAPGLATSPAAGPPPLAEVIHGLLAAAWRRRYVIALPILVLPIVGGSIGGFAPRSFEARMSVLIQDPAKFNPFMVDLTVTSNLRDRMEGLRALVTSRYVLAEVAKDLNMIPRDASERQQSEAVSHLAAGVSVQLVGQEMVELRYRAANPAGMDQVLTRIGERFIERVRGPEDSSLRSSTRFLEEQMRTATAELDEVETRLAGFKTEHAAQLPDLRATNIQRLASLREQLADREVKLAGAEGEVGAMRERLLATNPVLGRIEQDIVTTMGELALLRARYTEDHSKVQAAQFKLERLEDERLTLLEAARTAPSMDPNRLWNLAAMAEPRSERAQPLLISQVGAMAGVRDRVEQYRAEVANLRAGITEVEARIAGSGEVERQIRGLERDVAVKAELVTTLRRRYEMAQVTTDLAIQQAPERIKIIDRPFVPTAPTRPMQLIFTMLGLVAGIGLGLGMAVLMELFDSTFRRPRDVEKATGVTVLARIPPLARA